MGLLENLGHVGHQVQMDVKGTKVNQAYLGLVPKDCKEKRVHQASQVKKETRGTEAFWVTWGLRAPVVLQDPKETRASQHIQDPQGRQGTKGIMDFQDFLVLLVAVALQESQGTLEILVSRATKATRASMESQAPWERRAKWVLLE